MVLILTGVTLTIDSVKIVDGDLNKSIKTSEKDIYRILNKNNYVLGDNDIVNFTGWDSNDPTIDIKRAITVSLTVDGKTYDLNVNDVTVQDILNLNNVSLNQHDIVNKSLNDKLLNGDSIVVQRLEYRTVTKKEDLPFQTLNKNSTTLLKGSTKTETAGQNGEKLYTYRETIVDGEVVSTDLMGSQIVKNPIDHVNLIGTAANNAPSTLKNPDSLAFDSNGKPLNYKKVLNGRAAAYSARPGSYTASGLPAIPGHVAVNPNIIPYGTKLYIATPDGSYVYGYSIAADTGTALMRNEIIVDVYFNTYQESANFGIKNVNVYILE